MKLSTLFLLTLSLVASLVNAQDPSASESAEFCWKDSYGRGVGTIPEDCPPGRERIGLFCYSKCPAGTRRFGFDCHSVCPAGFRDDGLFCRKAEYGRGAGYAMACSTCWAWIFPYPCKCINEIQHCEQKHGKGNCEYWGLLAYPKCNGGDSPFGCCICRPQVPDCEALGLVNGIDLSCAKRVIIGDPDFGSCKADQDWDAALCYPKCKSGYNGVGPVCWGKNPSGWVDCGFGSAQDGETCAQVIVDQITSVGEVALTVASLGTSAAAMKGADFASKFADFQKQFKKSRDQNEKFRDAIDTIDAIADAAGDMVDVQTLLNSDNPVDQARAAAEIAALFDPTGVMSVVAAYAYPTCSAYFPNEYN